MDERDPDVLSDAALKRVLETWAIDSPGDTLEVRLRTAYRAQVNGGRWPAWMGASVRVPVPVLVGLVAACVVSAAFAMAGRAKPADPTTRAVPSPTRPVPSQETTRSPVDRNAGLVGFEAVPEPKLTVLQRGQEQ